MTDSIEHMYVNGFSSKISDVAFVLDQYEWLKKNKQTKKQRKTVFGILISKTSAIVR